jgi:glycerol-3-phosphate dehydrogenase
VFRRTTIAISGQLNDALLSELATVAASILHWDAARLQDEINATRVIARALHGIALEAEEQARL